MAKVKRSLLMLLQRLAARGLTARYERDVYEYLAVAYPEEDPRQLRMLASNVIARLTGRAGQWGNQQNDR